MCVSAKNSSQAFSLPQYLEEHEYTHTGAKPFVCGINNCAETFRQRGKLSIHRKNAHQNRMNDDAGPMGVMNGLSVKHAFSYKRSKWSAWGRKWKL
eukprot:403365648